jgi:CRP-like cAMP-binding protein
VVGCVALWARALDSSADNDRVSGAWARCIGRAWICRRRCLKTTYNTAYTELVLIAVLPKTTCAHGVWRRGMPSNRSWYRRLWYLQHFNLFREFTRDELLPVAQLVDPHELARHNHLYHSGDPADHVYLLIEGRVKIYRKSPSGRRVTLAVLQPGEVFGELNVYPVYEQEAEALEPSTIYRLRTQDFRALLASKPELALQVMRRLGRRKRLLERKIASLVFKDVPTRLAETLLELAEELGQPCAHGFALDLVLTQQELADLIGATRQIVNATLKQWQQQGMIMLRRQRLCLADRDALRRVASSANTLS